MESNELARYWDNIEALATGRKYSLFHQDFLTRKSILEKELQGARVCVIGAAGSIGSEVARVLSRYRLSQLSLFDISENNLVEVVRDLRSSSQTNSEMDLQVLPLGVGEEQFTQFFRTQSYDLVLNFSAMKHVRSEKDVYCLRRMLGVNVVALSTLMEMLPKTCHRVFSVSSDKAVRPSNLMGASKNLMEQVLLYLGNERLKVTSARFANVAFSEGSLPSGFLKRIQKNQPLAAPNDVRRYFISHREAAELSILAAVTGEDAEVFLPKQGGELPEVSFSEIAIRLLESQGYTPVECASEDEARQQAHDLISQKKWPCIFQSSNTTGEKDLEEFVGEHDKRKNQKDLKKIEVVERVRSTKERQQFIEFLSLLRGPEAHLMSKADLVSEISKAVPSLTHVELNKNLDSKM